MGGGASALGEAVQGQVISGFGPDVEQGESQIPEPLQRLRRLLQQVPRRGVGADPPEAREGGGQGLQDGLPVIEVHAQRVAIGHEDMADLFRSPSACF